jgi:hypothetical protein
MSKMGSHDPFGYLKHKLWPKEGSGVKLAVWLPTTKSRESPWFPCVQVVCHIPLKSSQRGLQICFRCHFNQRFAHKVMGPQSRGNPNLRNFEIPKAPARPSTPKCYEPGSVPQLFILSMFSHLDSQLNLSRSLGCVTPLFSWGERTRLFFFPHVWWECTFFVWTVLLYGIWLVS